MAQRQIEDETEVFDDTVLQYLSAICPNGMHDHSYHNSSKSTILDYMSFKKAVMNGLFMDEPHSTSIAQQKWDQYGQKFLQLCVEHKTCSLKFVQFLTMLFDLILYDHRSKPSEAAFSSALHSRYEYKSPVVPSSKTAPQPSGLRKSKFKPALKS